MTVAIPAAADTIVIISIIGAIARFERPRHCSLPATATACRAMTEGGLLDRRG
jgi:hypothetical protein